MEYDIFISYSRDDSAIVNTFVQQLEAAGYKVWIDKTGIYTGTRFKSVLVQAIEDSKVFLFFSSKGANASPWTAKEVAIAVDRKKTIIPIKLDSTRYNRDVEFDLIGLDYVDYLDKSNRNEEFNKLLRSLEIIFDRKPIDSLVPRIKTDETKEKKFASFLKNHRRWVIPLAVISLLLLIGVPLYLSSNGSDHSLKVEKQVESEAEKKYKKAAEQGDAEAQYNLGRCYYDGDGITQDHKEAVKWYRNAAEQGHAAAQNRLGVCYYDGEGVKQNFEEAAKWYRKAAEQGYAKAQYNLGLCYHSGNGVKQDYEEAVKWYRKAVEQGHAMAQNNLGRCYEDGEGITQDYKEAVKWYKKAAEQGNARAQCDLAHCLMRGYGLTEDKKEAVKWYRKAAEQDYPFALYQLGNCYYFGDGVAEDKKEAVKWYRKAAEQGNARAQYKLAVCYEDGDGVPKDQEKAMEWYRKAAHQGDKDAQEAIMRLTAE